MTIIAIGGEPAVGKTTLMKAFLLRLEEKYGKPKTLKYGTLWGHEFGERIAVLGKYHVGGPFEGTDRLSMSVQTDAKEFMGSPFARPVVIFEGDRLFNRSFLDFCHALAGSSLHVIVLHTAAQAILDERHKQRGDSQSETFLKGRRTKIANIKRDAKFSILELEHSTPDHTQWILRELDLMVHPAPAPIVKEEPYRSVMITREEATEALTTRGEDAVRLLIRRFKENFGLEFKPEDFNDRARFIYDYGGESRDTAKGFRVSYLN